MSELSRSHAADIADTRFAAAIREAGRLAVRAMSGYGMAACGAKRTFTRTRSELVIKSVRDASSGRPLRPANR